MTRQFVNDDNDNELDAEFLRRDPWRTWTPTVTQGVAVTVTVTFARYMVLARVVHMLCSLAVTSTGTGGSVIQVGSIPSVIAPANTGGFAAIGNGLITDVGTANYHGALLAVGASDFRLLSDGNGNYIGATPSFALVSGDLINFQATYER